MKNETIWAIRDARGLSTSEKAFLFVVESRGTARTFRKTLMNDTGASDGQITNLVRSLTAKGCIVKGRSGRKTTYRVNRDGVLALVPKRGITQSVSDTTQSVSDTTQSVSIEDSPGEDNKKNMKKNSKKKVKKNTTASVVAYAPTNSVEILESTLQREATESFSCIEQSTEPWTGTVQTTDDGRLIFAVKKSADFAYLLCDSGVTGPLTLDNPSVPKEANSPVLGPSEGLPPDTARNVEEQVALIAESEGWNHDFTQRVLALALDPSFEPKKHTGSRIFEAKCNVQYVASPSSDDDAW